MSQSGFFEDTTSLADIELIAGNIGGPIGPDAAHTVFILGGNNITTSGLLNTLTINLTGTTNHAVQIGNALGSLTSIAIGTNGQVLLGSTGADPVFATLTSIGGTVTYTPGPGSLNLEVGGSVPTTFTTDFGNATPALNILNVFGGNNIVTSGVGNTLTIDLNGTTDHAVQVGNATGSLTSIAVGATGELLGGNTGGDPIFLSSSDGNFTFTSATAGVDRILTVSNTDNTVANSPANLQVTVGGPLNTGDPFVNFLVSTAGTYSIGIDNSVAGDPFKITASASPSAGSDLFTMTNTGVITLANDLDVTEGGTGVSTLTLHGILMGNGAGDIQATAEPANGQLLIGKTGDFPQLANLTPGAGIAITSGAGTITISVWGGGVSWTNINASQALVPNNGVNCTGGAGLSLSLPATSSIGDVIEVVLDGSTSWTITQGANQQIRLGSSTTTLGAGGSLASTAQGDHVKLVCKTANLIWTCIGSIGNITVV